MGRAGGRLPLLYGGGAVRVVLIMAATGLSGHLIYRRLKTSLVRERPFIRHPGINLAMPPLDRYSFPSGHTMHAVSFVWQAVAHFPDAELDAGAGGEFDCAVPGRARIALPD